MLSAPLNSISDLFEASLQRHVKAIAKGIDDSNPQKQEYLDLADKFRIPYWDWARLDVQIVPEVSLDPNYRPMGPPSSESSKRDYNPLFDYPFPEGTDSQITVGPPQSHFLS